MNLNLNLWTLVLVLRRGTERKGGLAWHVTLLARGFEFGDMLGGSVV
jgi:hypothetical protein